MAAWIAAHRKALAAASGAVIVLLVDVYGTNVAWLNLVIAAATAAGVYRVPNRQTSPPA